MKTAIFEEIFAAASSNGASDILLQEGKAPVLRINGQLHSLDAAEVTGERL